MVAPSAWASHILVPSKSEAMQIKDKVVKLKDFQKLARKKHLPIKSEGRRSWLVPQRPHGQEFEETVWSVPVNTVSAPVKTQFGYHLIWVHERDEDA